jgi:hypothetical protein
MNTTNDSDTCDDNKLLNEGDIESEIKLVQQYIKTNQEEYLASFLKIDGKLSIPKLERSNTYCAPKLYQSFQNILELAEDLVEEDLVEEGLEEDLVEEDLEEGLAEDLEEDLAEDLEEYPQEPIFKKMMKYFAYLSNYL